MYIHRYKEDIRHMVILFFLCMMVFVYFMYNTASRYEDSPLGDAKSYTLMAVHYKTPHTIRSPLPVIYANRMLPSLMVGGLTSCFIPKDKIQSLTSLDMLAFKEYRDVNTTIRRGYLFLNFVSLFFTVCFLYLSFTYLGCSDILAGGLSFLFTSIFIPVRLYICWPQMADPMGIMFLAALFYFLITERWIWFLAACLLTVMVRENNLLLLLSFWVMLFFKDIRLKKKIIFFAVSFLPILFFIFLRRNPFFPAQVSLPNSQYNFPPPSFLPQYLSDYFYISFYRSKIIAERHLYLNLILMPFYVFGPLVFILLKEIRTTFQLLMRYGYLIPYCLVMFYLGIGYDRHLFYLFPVVLLLSGSVIKRTIKGNSNVVVLVLAVFQMNMWLYDSFIAVTRENILFCDEHQLEYLFDRNSVLFYAIKTIVAGFIVLLVYIFLKRKTEKEKKADPSFS